MSIQKKEHLQVAHHRLDARHNDADFACLMLGSVGWSNKGIAKYTGLTEGQVGYRLQRYGISRTAYRNGESPAAKWILGKVEKALSRHIEGELRENGHLVTFGGGEKIINHI